MALRVTVSKVGIVSQPHSRSPGIVIVIIFSSYIFEGKDRKYDACWWAIRPTRVLRKKAVDHYTPYFPFYIATAHNCVSFPTFQGAQNRKSAIFSNPPSGKGRVGGRAIDKWLWSKNCARARLRARQGNAFFSEIYFRCPVVYFGMRYSSLITLQKLLIHAFVVVAFGFAKNVYL